VRTVVGLDALTPSTQGSAVTIGTFDGVHLGHRALIARTIAEAQARDIAAVAVTWDRHPNVTLRPDRVPPLLTTPERKVELLAETGLDLLVIVPFNKELSQWPPERFVVDVLAAGLAATAVLVGEGWRFGHKAVGDVALLAQLGEGLGMEAYGVELAELAGEPVSSSRVRAVIETGDMEMASTLLGRPFDLDGTVVHGDDRGASLGWPTANFELDPAMVRPPRGVYGGRARVGDTWYGAATNLGVNPTFGGDPGSVAPRVEAYLLDFEGDLYGEVLRVEFLTRLRDELKFDTQQELIEQIAKDVAATRALTDTL
jgi:riboflavin kinase/FMN adenylyltransferase